jgi:uncharacterized protein (TIGR02996 family)
MSEHDALLAAICAEPKEDTPRLVYADWLDENAGTVPCPTCNRQGRTPGRQPWVAFSQCSACDGSTCVSDGRKERAEFIRVQVELARLPETDEEYNALGHAGRVMDVMDRQRELRRREGELLRAHDDDWLPEWINGGTTDVSVVEGRVELLETAAFAMFSRGFISRITCSWTDWLAHADAIRAAQPVERVKLTTIVEFEIRRGDGAAFTSHGRNQYVFRASLSGPGRKVHTLRQDDGDTTDYRIRVLQAEWPGIAFELPAELEPDYPTFSRTYLVDGAAHFPRLLGNVHTVNSEPFAGLESGSVFLRRIDGREVGNGRHEVTLHFEYRGRDRLGPMQVVTDDGVAETGDRYHRIDFNQIPPAGAVELIERRTATGSGMIFPPEPDRRQMIAREDGVIVINPNYGRPRASSARPGTRRR